MLSKEKCEKCKSVMEYSTFSRPDLFGRPHREYLFRCTGCGRLMVKKVPLFGEGVLCRNFLLDKMGRIL